MIPLGEPVWVEYGVGLIGRIQTDRIVKVLHIWSTFLAEKDNMIGRIDIGRKLNRLIAIATEWKCY